jgi:glycosyltransferase involved in cell wall biosynthesis
MQPLVTIVTPSFNQGQFIEATIQSVLAQDYAPLEYLVYDAGSTDGTPAILARYRDRLHAVSRPDRGQADAINQGLRAARGEIVAWLNSDDLYLPGAIAAGVRHLTSHPEQAMVYGEARYVDAEGRPIGPYPTAPIARLREGCHICQPATFLRARAIATVGYLDPSLQYCLDYDLWLRLAACFQIGYLSHELACSRLHRGAKTIAHRRAFHREVVQMTHRRLGAAPLPWLYGFALLCVRDRFGERDRRVEGTLAAGLTLALTLRYHPRPTRDDVRVAQRWLRAQFSGPAGATIAW